MTAAFFIALREGLEAALIVGIIAAYLVKLDRRDALRGVWVGVGAAVTLSIVVGIVVVATVGRLPLVVQESIEGIAAVIAVVVLTWMLFWMRRQGRAMKGELERGVDIALAGGSILALAGLAFVSVAREGLETVLFLYAIGSSSGPALQTLVAALAGLAAAVGIGWAIFAAGVRVDLRRFFTITGVVLIFVSAGLVAHRGPRVRRGRPHRQQRDGVQPRRDPARVEPARSRPGRPVRLPLDADAARGHRLPGVPDPGPGHLRQARDAVRSEDRGCAATLVDRRASGGCGACASSGSSAPPASVPADAIAVTASEYKFDPSTLSTKAGAVTFAVTNGGTTEHEFEIFQGDKVIDEIEGLTPGLTKSLTVTLTPGAYTYVCKLAGHDQLGMKGDLTGRRRLTAGIRRGARLRGPAGRRRGRTGRSTRRTG